jgi:hypothetical protein
MFRILGGGEHTTIAEPHKIPVKTPVNSPATPPLKERRYKLEPISSHERALSADSPRNGSISAYRTQAESGAERSKSSSHVAKKPSSDNDALQQQLTAQENVAYAVSDEVSQLRQLYLQSVREAATNKAELQSLTKAVHSLQQAAASVQVCCTHAVLYVMSCEAAGLLFTKHETQS